jgi:hypothetical protein
MNQADRAAHGVEKDQEAKYAIEDALVALR